MISLSRLIIYVFILCFYIMVLLYGVSGKIQIAI